MAHDSHLPKTEPFADLFEEGNDPGQVVPAFVRGRRGAPAPGSIHQMTAKQVRHQCHVRPCQMCPEPRSTLDPYQGPPVADGFPLNGTAVLKRQNLGQRVLGQRHRIRLPPSCRSTGCTLDFAANDVLERTAPRSSATCHRLLSWAAERFPYPRLRQPVHRRGSQCARSGSPPSRREFLKMSTPMLEHAVRVAGAVPPDDLDRNDFGAFLDAPGQLQVKYLPGRIEQPPAGDVGT